MNHLASCLQEMEVHPCKDSQAQVPREVFEELKEELALMRTEIRDEIASLPYMNVVRALGEIRGYHWFRL